MAVPTENETWVIEIGDAVIRKMAQSGANKLLPWETLVYCLWAADYGMRNAGDLEAAAEVCSEFKSDGARLAAELGLSSTYEAFALSKDQLENQYYDRFESICEEIRKVRPAAAVDVKVRQTRSRSRPGG